MCSEQVAVIDGFNLPQLILLSLYAASSVIPINEAHLIRLQYSTIYPFMNLTGNHLVSGKAARGDASRQPRIHWPEHVLDERMVPVLVPALVLLTFLVLVLPLCFALWPSRSCEAKPAAPRR